MTFFKEHVLSYFSPSYSKFTYLVSYSIVKGMLKMLFTREMDTTMMATGLELNFLVAVNAVLVAHLFQVLDQGQVEHEVHQPDALNIESLFQVS